MNTDQISRESAIRRISEFYHAQYDPTLIYLDAYDQLNICEVINDTDTIKIPNESAPVYENGNGGCKHIVNQELKQHKQKAFNELKMCNANTPPNKIADLLTAIFSSCASKNGHWLFISQTYTPRSIVWALQSMIKKQAEGWETINCPAAYFTNSIRFRKKRSKLRRNKK